MGYRTLYNVEVVGGDDLQKYLRDLLAHNRQKYCVNENNNIARTISISQELNFYEAIYRFFTPILEVFPRDEIQEFSIRVKTDYSKDGKEIDKIVEMKINKKGYIQFLNWYNTHG